MIRNIVTVVLVGIVTLCFDYAKIRMVVESRASALAALGAGVRFVVKHPVRTVMLAVSLAAIGVVCAAVFVVLESEIRQSSSWMILAVFVLQQLYVWSRQWIRAAFYAAQTALYQGSVIKTQVTGVQTTAKGPTTRTDGMNELRYNIVTGDWVIIARDRSRRPTEYVEPPQSPAERLPYLSSCPFCPGNERETAPEEYSISGPEKSFLRFLCKP